MNRTEYIGKLNALYVGDKNCLEELITAYDEKDKEIERLNNDIKELLKENENKEKVIKAQDNIIKEVREYIENHKQYAELEDYGKNGEYYIDEIGLLEILDKENKL